MSDVRSKLANVIGNLLIQATEAQFNAETFSSMNDQLTNENISLKKEIEELKSKRTETPTT